MHRRSATGSYDDERVEEPTEVALRIDAER
jgi:hypothetical protein